LGLILSLHALVLTAVLQLEKDRLDLQHHLYKLMLDERLYLAPIKKNPQNVLDIGTGTGLWAIEFGSSMRQEYRSIRYRMLRYHAADENPSAVVVGTDLSPIQPSL
jgi:ubiquinone/menaquinone biosynthesis C-methylase UbiE